MAAPNAGPQDENDGKDDAIEPTDDGPTVPQDDLRDVEARWADIVADLSDVSAAAESAAAEAGTDATRPGPAALATCTRPSRSLPGCRGQDPGLARDVRGRGPRGGREPFHPSGPGRRDRP
ncbi:hypothetical protein NKG05_26560 [Oerskovia sp. M15]